MSTVQHTRSLTHSSPCTLKIVRIMTAVQVMRLAGIQLFTKGQAGIFPSYFAYPFGVGDLFVALLALPIAYYLHTGGIRKYALAISWNSVGLADLLFALAVASYGGINPTIISDLQTAPIVVPLSIVLHILTIILLLGKRLKQFFTPSDPLGPSSSVNAEH